MQHLDVDTSGIYLIASRYIGIIRPDTRGELIRETGRPCDDTLWITREANSETRGDAGGGRARGNEIEAACASARLVQNIPGAYILNGSLAFKYPAHAAKMMTSYRCSCTFAKESSHADAGDVLRQPPSPRIESHFPATHSSMSITQ